MKVNSYQSLYKLIIIILKCSDDVGNASNAFIVKHVKKIISAEIVYHFSEIQYCFTVGNIDCLFSSIHFILLTFLMINTCVLHGYYDCVQPYKKMDE